jgi:hypothetical protein
MGTGITRRTSGARRNPGRGCSSNLSDGLGCPMAVGIASLVGSVFDRVTTSLRHWLRAEHQPGIAGRFFIRLGATQAARVTSRVTGRTEVRATTAKIVSSSTKYRVG